MADKNLESKLGIKEIGLSDGTALLIEDPNNDIKGIIYQGKKLINPDQLRDSVEQRYELKKENEFLKDLLNMHRYFDGLRDFIGSDKTTNEQKVETIESCMKLLAEEMGVWYLGFHINPELIKNGQINPEYSNAQCIELISSKKGYVRINGDGQRFFTNFRKDNPGFEIDCEIAQNNYVEDFESLDDKVKVEGYDNLQMRGSGFVWYLRPGDKVIGAIEAIQTKKPLGRKEKEFIKEWGLLADTFLKDTLGVKSENKGNDELELENMFGISVDDLTSDYVGGGDYEKIGINVEGEKEVKKGWIYYNPGSFFDDKFSDIREGIISFCGGFTGYKDILNGVKSSNLEEISSNKYERAIRFVREIYKERPEFEISKEESERDLNSAESCMKIIYGLFEVFGDKISKDFKLKNKTPVDKETLRDAAMFCVAFAKAPKYMHQADHIPRIEEIRRKNDMREMTGYLAEMMRYPELTGEYVYNGEPLVNKIKKQSLLGSTIIDLSEGINPDSKSSYFVVDLIEKVMEYEKRVQNTPNSTDINEIIWGMYEGCYDKKGIDENSMRATFYIDNLVNPKDKIVYNEFKNKHKKK